MGEWKGLSTAYYKEREYFFVARNSGELCILLLWYDFYRKSYKNGIVLKVICNSKIISREYVLVKLLITFFQYELASKRKTS